MIFTEEVVLRKRIVLLNMNEVKIPLPLIKIREIV